MADDKKFPPDSSITDKKCCFLFLASCGIMALIMAVAAFNGDTKRLTHGVQYDGKLCGASPGVEDKKYVYYCAGQERDPATNVPKRLHLASKTCVKECPGPDSPREIGCLMRAYHHFKQLPSTVQASAAGNVSFVETLQVDITQTVTMQMSYPTKPWIGKPVCEPLDGNLRSQLYDHLGWAFNFSRSLGSFSNGGWIIIAGVAILTVILGLVYLHLLKSLAGPLIFASLCLATTLLCVLGIFLFIGVLFNPWDEDGWYQQMSPIFMTYYGTNDARGWSFFWGVLITAIGVFMGFTTFHSMDKIDESIGIIAAACDCLFAPGAYELILAPVVQGAAILALIGVGLFWAEWVHTVGYTETDLLAINGRPFPGLQKEFRFYPWWKPCMFFYWFCFFWFVEMIVAIGNFSTSYAVCSWYYVEGDDDDDEEGIGNMSGPFSRAYENYGKHVSGIRIGGVDNVVGERHGYIEEGKAGKVLVVPIGKRGPGGLDFIPQDEKRSTKRMPIGSMLKGFCVGFWKHLGTFALGALINTVTRPFRLVSQVIRAFMGKADTRGSFDDEDRTPYGVMVAGCGLLSGVLDQFFGGYSKTLYVDVALTGSNDYWQAARDSFDFIAESGGVVSFLHGSTAIYESIGVVCITVLVTLIASLVMTKVSYFNEMTVAGDLDPTMMTAFCAVVSFLIASGFMNLFNNVADTLLYVFAWSRSQATDGKERDELEKYCPASLRYLVEDEMDAAPTETLEEKSRGKMTRFAHAGKKFMGTAMDTVAMNSMNIRSMGRNLTSSAGPPQGHEQVPLMSGSGYHR